MAWARIFAYNNLTRGPMNRAYANAMADDLEVRLYEVKDRAIERHTNLLRSLPMNERVIKDELTKIHEDHDLACRLKLQIISLRTGVPVVIEDTSALIKPQA
jgi:hypothetical protein